MKPVLEQRWAQRTIADGVDVTAWPTTLQRSPLVCHLLALRGIANCDEASSFLTGSLSSLPDPFLLAGMEQAVARLVIALEAGERMAVHGDYDVDGITGTAILVEALTLFGAEVDYHIPLRMRDGYGLSEQAIRQADEDNVTLLLSVDCGITAIDEAALASQLGIDLIITDHHQPLDTLPVAHSCISSSVR